MSRSDLDAEAQPVTVPLIPCEDEVPYYVDGEERGRDIIVSEQHNRGASAQRSGCPETSAARFR